MTPSTWRTIFLTAVAALVLWLAYEARTVVTPLLVALVLAYILDPVVRMMERWGMSRALASGSLVVLALAALVTVVAVAATQFVSEAGAFYSDVTGEPTAEPADRAEFSKGRDPAFVHETTWNDHHLVYFDANGDGAYRPGHAALALVKVRTALADTRFAGVLDGGLRSITQFGPQIAQSANAALAGLVAGFHAAFSTFFGLLTVAVLFPIYLFYSMVNLSRVYDVGVRHLPQGQRARIVEILQKIHVTISAFFRGRLITMFVKGLLLLGLFVAFGVPFSYVCAGFAALASLVPVVGGIAAGIPPIVLALPDSSGGAILGLAIGILVVEGIEAYVLIPVLIGRRVGLHSLTVLVCTLVAGDLLGFFGMIVAVPLTAVLKILAAEFVLPEVRRRAGLPPIGAPESDA